MNKNKFLKGFTLIELLVVIGVLAVIAAGVVALINPQDKLAQAGDSKVQSDMGQVATALQSFAAQNAAGTYPAGANWAAVTAALGSSGTGTGELVNVPQPGTGRTYVYSGGATACIGGLLTSRKYTQPAAPAGCGGSAVCYWKWRSNTGAVTVEANATCP